MTPFGEDNRVLELKLNTGMSDFSADAKNAIVVEEWVQSAQITSSFNEVITLLD